MDARIRQHVWASLSKERLASAVTRVEEVARWPVPPVTARHVVLDGEVLAGHQGEWFSVMAGALGRALALSDAPVVERTTAWIEAELAREARLVTFARKNGTARELLCTVTTVAHNVGDLSRGRRYLGAGPRRVRARAPLPAAGARGWCAVRRRLRLRR